jgi:ribose 5-phosphate isomerase B
MTKIYVGSDHAGYLFKTRLLQSLKPKLTDFTFEDLGSFDEKSVDYPDYADKVAKKVAAGEGLGLLICGSGIGMDIRANRYKNVRAANCWDKVTARLSRSHNNANVLCLAARLLPLGLAEEMTEIFYKTSFEGGRHEARVKKLE